MQKGHDLSPSSCVWTETQSIIIGESCGIGFVLADSAVQVLQSGEQKPNIDLRLVRILRYGFDSIYQLSAHIV